MDLENQYEQISVLREIRNEINLPDERDRIAMQMLQGVCSAHADEFWITLQRMPDAIAQAYAWADAVLAFKKAGK